MLIGVISDTHMPKRKLPSVFPEVLERLSNMDLILHAGDICSLSVLQEFKQLASLEAVVGNNDEYKLQQQLEKKLEFFINGHRIGLTHGHLGKGRSTLDRARNTFENVDLIIFGHSHIPYNEVYQGVRMLNPGSLTDKRRQPKYSYGIISVTKDNLETWIEYL